MPRQREREPFIRIAMFIDGANLFHTAKNIGMNVDFKKLLNLPERENGKLFRAYYYSAVKDGAEELAFVVKLLDYLEYNGYTVVTKMSKTFNGKTKGNMDVELAVDALNLSKHYDKMYLFSGDGDFEYLVRALQYKGIQVCVISTIQTHPPMIADELRRVADEFIDLNDLRPLLSRTALE